jgi:1-deoxy-D-xylulose-5-phosphate reductoisomerase
VRRVVVLGSTGSIGRQTLDVIRAHPDRFEVIGLAAGRNSKLLADQIVEFEPAFVACLALDELLGHLARLRVDLPEVVSPVEMAATPEVDIVVSGMVGKGGLEPTLAALTAGKVLALANKETMVMAGALVRQAAAAGGGEIRPVDSEHSAIWQCLVGEAPEAVRRLIVTASGGALRDLDAEALAAVSPEQALAHPTWQMGSRITLDSATLFNKGLEVIEARWLFDVPFERIDVVMHRESIIHSLVELVDGSMKAQLSCPDMRLPIQYALTYPDRFDCALEPLDLARIGSLNFGAPDLGRYPCLDLALQAGRAGGTTPAALAAADEVAVGAFLERRIGFLDIPRLLADTLEEHASVSTPSLEAVLAADAWGRQFAQRWCESRS